MIIRKAVEVITSMAFFNTCNRKFLSEKLHKKSSAVALLFYCEN